ncbi:ArpU family phage packaging/lysis transcriptional regulator [Pediococcus pentosaceus]|uniref:ArpU family phage packaging/lysis transcriptional regulator n=1 Tax=Pediococcus pentosaceus TaxID=1255 RepID=UPI0018A16155|nr:ArpU family phage packaging/lysis transcriptional regulator [Pediococcus pentosaceus]MBF7102166.1 RNA polymerase subunit sigma-70 [Pediococcus pentosaceus]MBF7138611.1 RNA polymerase subunit sigma-70 [Pediococcus pentosaceus]
MLLPELDHKATIKRVKRFFEKDFQTLQNMAHVSYMDIKSPTLSDLPNKSVASNGNDSKMNNHMYALQMLAEVKEVLTGIRENKRKFIEYRYFKCLTWYEIGELTGYGRTQGNSILNSALIEFAYAFVDTEDLRVIKKNGTQ